MTGVALAREGSATKTLQHGCWTLECCVLASRSFQISLASSVCLSLLVSLPFFQLYLVSWASLWTRLFVLFWETWFAGVMWGLEPGRCRVLWSLRKWGDGYTRALVRGEEGGMW